MENQVLFSSKGKSKKNVWGALKVGSCPNNYNFFFILICVAFK